MKLIFVLILTCTLWMYCGVCRNRVPRYVGGHDAKRGQFPYMVSLRYRQTGQHFCGGSIIRQKLILTSAHCLRGKSRRDVYIVAGINNLNAKAKHYYTEKWSVHYLYNSNISLNDVAIIKLKKALKFSKTIQKIPVDKHEPSIGVPMTICGWGDRFHGGYLSSTLQFSNVTSIPLKECQKKMNKQYIRKPVTKRHVCTYDGPNIGFCDGDSGGPLVYKGKQVGIVAWSVYCGSGLPDVYVKLSSYAKWIDNTVKKFSKKKHKYGNVIIHEV